MKTEVQPRSRTALVNKLHAAHDDFVTICSTLPPELRERAGSCGVWSPRQVVAHLAGWDQEAARRILILVDEPRSSKAYDVDRENARWVAERNELDWFETLTSWQDAFATLAAAAMALTEADFLASPAIADWLAGRTGDYRHHAEALTAWVQREGNHHG